jgi:hypothetical protein
MASESPTPPGPPRYILVSQSILSDSVATDSSHRALSHPIIQYVYADDPPTAALPRFPGEQVLVIDNSSTSDPTLVPSSSLSPDLIVTGVKISAAPGTTLMDADVPLGNNNMYVIETMRVKDEGYSGKFTYFLYVLDCLCKPAV